MSTDFAKECPFCGILFGEEPGKVIARDDNKKLALVSDIHPEAAIHWLAIPFEHLDNTEEMEHNHQDRFFELTEFAIAQTKAQMEEYPILKNGFTIKYHFGGFETAPHAKLHIISTE